MTKTGHRNYYNAQKLFEQFSFNPLLSTVVTDTVGYSVFDSCTIGLSKVPATFVARRWCISHNQD